MSKTKIFSDKIGSNPHFLGMDENHDGDWDEWYSCPNCKELSMKSWYSEPINNYVSYLDKQCGFCDTEFEWIELER